MGLCVILAADGTLEPTGQALSDCAGYVLVTPTDAAQLAVLETLWSFPDAGVATVQFTGIVVAIIGAFLTGRAFSKPANLVR